MVNDNQSDERPLTYGEFKMGITMVLNAIRELHVQILESVQSVRDSRYASRTPTAPRSRVIHHEDDVNEEVKTAMELIFYDQVTEMFPPEDLATTATNTQSHADFIFKHCFDDNDVQYVIDEIRKDTGVTVDPALLERLGRDWILERVLWESNKNGNTDQVE